MSPPLLSARPSSRVQLRSSTLAREFAVFNSWFSSAPGPTLVNRAFLVAATSAGYCRNQLSPDDLVNGTRSRTIFQVGYSPATCL
jgi:phospholipase C